MKCFPDLSRKRKWFLFSILFIFLIFGLCITDDYGVSTDEFFELKSAHVNFKYIFEDFLKNEIDNPGIMIFLEETPELSSYVDRYYGIILQLPMVFLELFRDFSLDSRYVLLSRHLFVFLNFTLGLSCFFLFLRRRLRSDVYALIGVLFMALSPKIFAESFYNIKDIMFLSWVMIGLYFIQRYAEKESLVNAALAGIVIAVASNVRMYGILLLVPLFAESFIRGFILKKDSRFQMLILCIGTAIVLYIAFSPALWENPIKEFIRSAAVFSSFSHPSEALFNGQVIEANKIWYYIPANIWISTPILYSFLFLVGILFFVPTQIKLIKRRDFIGVFCDFSVLILCLIPLLFQMLAQSTVYDGWRHYYFIYCGLIYFAILGLKALFSFFSKRQHALMRIANFFLVCICVGSCLYTLSRMIALHPFEFLYLNPIMKARATDFPRDYWGLSHRAVLEDLAKMAEDEPIEAIGRDGYNLYNNYLILPKEIRGKLNIHSYSNLYPARYYVIIYQYDAVNEIDVPWYAKIRDYEKNGVRYASLYEIKESTYYSVPVKIARARASSGREHLGDAFDGNKETWWRTEKVQGYKDYFEMEFDRIYSFSRIDLENYRYLGYAQKPEFFCSLDMQNWVPLETLPLSDKFRYLFEPATCKGIRIENKCESDRYWSISEVKFYGNILEN